MAVTKLIKFRGEIERTIKKQGNKPTVFPPIKTIFEKFPDIQHKKAPKDITKSKVEKRNRKSISPKQNVWNSANKNTKLKIKTKKKVALSGWGAPIGKKSKTIILDKVNVTKKSPLTSKSEDKNQRKQIKNNSDKDSKPKLQNDKFLEINEENFPAPLVVKKTKKSENNKTKKISKRSTPIKNKDLPKKKSIKKIQTEEKINQIKVVEKRKKMIKKQNKLVVESVKEKVQEPIKEITQKPKVISEIFIENNLMNEENFSPQIKRTSTHKMSVEEIQVDQSIEDYESDSDDSMISDWSSQNKSFQEEDKIEILQQQQQKQEEEQIEQEFKMKVKVKDEKIKQQQIENSKNSKKTPSFDNKILDALRSKNNTQIQSRFEFANKKQNFKNNLDQDEDFFQLSQSIQEFIKKDQIEKNLTRQLERLIFEDEKEEEMENDAQHDSQKINKQIQNIFCGELQYQPYKFKIQNRVQYRKSKQENEQIGLNQFYLQQQQQRKPKFMDYGQQQKQPDLKQMYPGPSIVINHTQINYNLNNNYNINKNFFNYDMEKIKAMHNDQYICKMHENKQQN